MSYTESFRFGEFIGSVLWLVFWVLIIFSLVGLPLLFVVLFYVPLPPLGDTPLPP